ncbi:hypothetical protein A1O1_05267 [Capronia coronata CBS 617.96]|uniref:Uncharacterized protein n=1 Tax=Capronia coronata CBS 617.96 TaxID=1182541 RepID=W9Y698_9EURO|nr:uncharacterized protein A1O1_05267 [Capronia coronata CBS 617.96]EXJ88337.1 hypothetical protein A1O1_05267 [Capronia coronata CBS 617.96]
MAFTSSTTDWFGGEMTMSQHRQPQQSVFREPRMAAFFICSSEYPKGKIFQIEKPSEISLLPPVAIRRPAFPDMRKQSMQMLTPCTLFAIEACRKCPLHQNPAQANPISNRPEDFLATDKQKDVCDEMLARSLACDWSNMPVPPLKQKAEDVMDLLPYHRESTPKNLQDVRMLETVFEADFQAQVETASAPVQGSYNFGIGPWDMQIGQLQRPFGQRG